MKPSSELNAYEQKTTSLFKDALTYAPSIILPAVLAMCSAAIFTRLFIPKEYGQFLLINSIAAPVISIVSQIFGQPAGRYFAELKHEGMDQVYSHVLALIIQRIVLAMGLVLASMSVVIWIIEPTFRDWLPLILGAGVGVGVQSVSAVLTPLLPLVRDFKGYRQYMIGYGILTLIFPLGLVVLLGAHIIWMVWGSTMAGTVMLIPLLQRTQPHAPLQFVRINYAKTERDLFQRFIRYGGPMAVWFFAASMISVSDRYVLAAYWGSGVVAIYGSSYAIAAQVIGLLSSVITTAAWPSIMTTWATTKSVSRVRLIMARATEMYLMLGIGLVGGSVVTARDVVGLILSPKYLPGYAIIPPVMAGLVLWGSSTIGHKSMEVMERNDIMIWNAIAAAVLNLGVNILLVPWIGWKIAAYTTLFSYLSYTTVTWWIARRMIPWDVHFGRLGLYLLTGLVADIVSRSVWSGHSFLISLIIRGLIYSAIYFSIMILIHRRSEGTSQPI